MATKILEEKRDATSALLYASEQQVVNRLLWIKDITEGCHASIVSTATLVIRGAQAHKGTRRAWELFKHTFGLLTNEGIALSSWREALLSTLNTDNADHLSAAPNSLRERGKSLVAVVI